MAAETGAFLPSAMPADFIDRLSDEFLLAPDSDFIFARWLFSAMLQENMRGVDGIDVVLEQFKDGRSGPRGVLANMNEAMAQGRGGPLLLSRMNYPDMIKVVTDPTKAQEGETIKINRPKYLDSSTTASDYRISATAALFGSNGQTPGMDQVSVTIYENAGPVDSSGTRKPINLAEFTRKMSRHDLLNYVGKLLRQNRVSMVHYWIAGLLSTAAEANGVTGATGGITFPTGISAKADFTGSGNEPFTLNMLFEGATVLANRKVPGIGGSNRYMAVLDERQYTSLKNDDQYQRLSTFQEEYNPLFPGYKRTIDNVIICTTNAMPQITTLGGGAVTGNQGYIVAPNLLGYGCAQEAQVLRDRNDDGGRFNRVGWNAYEGMDTLDSRFVQKLISCDRLV